MEDLSKQLEELKNQLQYFKQLEANEKAKLQAEEYERLKLKEEFEKAVKSFQDEKSKLEAEKKAKLQAEAEEKARVEAEEKARVEAEEKARVEAEEKSKLEAELIEAKRKKEEDERLKNEEESRLMLEAKHKLELEEKEKEEEIINKYLEMKKHEAILNNKVHTLVKQGPFVRCLLNEKSVFDDREIDEDFLPNEELKFLVYLDNKTQKTLVLKDKKLKFDEEKQDYKIRKSVLVWICKDEEEE
jgi:hypothetical protein